MNELISLLTNELKIDFAIDVTTPLVSSGLIDSLHLTELLASLESHYGVRIPPSEIGVDNFDTPQQMYQLIQANL